MLRTRERDGGEVVGIAGIGQDDRAAALDGAERELHQAGLRAGQDGDFPGRVEVHVVELAVALRDRFLQRGQAGEGRVAVDVVALGALGQGVNDVSRRADLGVPAPEVDERLATLCSRRSHPRQQCSEVLLRQPLDPLRDLAHCTMLCDCQPVKRQISLRDAARRAVERRHPRRPTRTG